jgi:6-phosphogluconolactonase
MSYKLITFDRDDHMTQALVAAACLALRPSQTGTPQSLLLSGGSSPRAFYQALGTAQLDWSKLHMALVDERWVSAEDAGSNTRFIETSLRAGAASAAPFTPMNTAHTTPHDSAAKVSAAYGQLPQIGLTILGMGPDAHTASWFEKAPEYDAVSALDAPLAIGGVTAPASEVTGDYLQRSTITGRTLAQSNEAFLILKGAERLAIFQRCMKADLQSSPIGRAAAILGQKLRVFALTGDQ